MRSGSVLRVSPVRNSNRDRLPSVAPRRSRAGALGLRGVPVVRTPHQGALLALERSSRSHASVLWRRPDMSCHRHPCSGWDGPRRDRRTTGGAVGGCTPARARTSREGRAAWRGCVSAHDIYCQHCARWIGDTSEQVRLVAVYRRAPDRARVPPPRSTWQCKDCGCVNVFCPLTDRAANPTV